ncbi:MAG: purine-binding chemotaxis protein CheW [Methanocalculus sp. MSAO_Arc1]|uniref:chemotaxis protein CheW n=1 Tax=Methanocalculus TaxID=71151 RepID=UPI000FF49C3A|nr:MULTISPECIES: chemotaxis protein CheW [unclassified Methanocalculus]MCP1661404.1 purine-binding chemotaxis protein CheW [Methanocalculus sp. AMF5]RQD80414.1 MAG: purine-binding chemotaxis protein CheW [Methanocalculus sp. MSAO_Arc1]
MVSEAQREDAGSIAGSIQVVEFILGDEKFAIDLFEVREVVEYTRISALPNSPSYIKGIIDLRGEITTIIDLKERLNIRSSDRAEEESRIIVLDENITKKKVGIMVDDVLSVSTFEMSQVDETGAADDTDEDSCILGIIKKKGQAKERDATDLIIWVDIKQLLGEMLKTLP